MNYFVVFCLFLCNLFAVHVGSGRKRGKGPKQDSPLLINKKVSNTGKKQKTAHDPMSGSIGSSLPPVSGSAPGSPGNWIPSDCNFAKMFYGF